LTLALPTAPDTANGRLDKQFGASGPGDWPGPLQPTRVLTPRSARGSPPRPRSEWNLTLAPTPREGARCSTTSEITDAEPPRDERPSLRAKGTATRLLATGTILLAVGLTLTSVVAEWFAALARFGRPTTRPRPNRRSATSGRRSLAYGRRSERSTPRALALPESSRRLSIGVYVRRASLRGAVSSPIIHHDSAGSRSHHPALHGHARRSG
jgi:hypothetical protein